MAERYLRVAFVDSSGEQITNSFCNHLEEFGLLATTLENVPPGTCNWLFLADTCVDDERDTYTRFVRVAATPPPSTNPIISWRANEYDLGIISDVLQDAEAGEIILVLVALYRKEEYDALPDFEGF